MAQRDRVINVQNDVKLTPQYVFMTEKSETTPIWLHTDMTQWEFQEASEADPKPLQMCAMTLNY